MSGRLNSAAKSILQLSGSVACNAEAVLLKISAEDSVNSFRTLMQRLEKDKRLQSLNKEQHREMLTEIINENSFIEAAWTNDVKGRFICSIPDAGLANAGVREWFKQSISGNEYVSSVYISAITRNPCLTISAPIRDASGSIIGVLGIDVKLE
jgi:hypothetical protein